MLFAVRSPRLISRCQWMYWRLGVRVLFVLDRYLDVFSGIGGSAHDESLLAGHQIVTE